MAINKKPELIAPAGNLEKMKTAFAFGADAVYAGIPDFSMRARVNNFTISDLKKAAAYAHGLRKKIYITVNIIAHNRHLKKLPAHIRKIKNLKPDGLVVSDPGVLLAIKKLWPQAKIHLSTQANCTNWQSARFWQKQGVSRIILGREVSLEEIKEISKRAPELGIESFVHGAMCMAYSGRCFLSKYFTGRSANLGDCIQPCRWQYYIKKQESKKIRKQNKYNYFIQPEGRDEQLELGEEEHGSYILNSQDLCLIKKLDKLSDAGISSFKIEGRAKSVYYLACVVGAYRKAIDIIQESNYRRAGFRTQEKNKVINFLYKELEEKLFNRGYTEGFIFGQGRWAQNLENSHNISQWEFCGQAIKSKKFKVKSKKFLNYIKVHNSIKVGDNIEIVMPKYDIIKMKINKLLDVKTREEINEAHGGQGKTVIVESDKNVPEYSVIRRKIK